MKTHTNKVAYDLCRNLNPCSRENTLFSSDHTLGHKENINKFQRTERILYGHNKIKEIIIN